MTIVISIYYWISSLCVGVGATVPWQLHMQTYLCGYVLLHIFSKILQFTSQTGNQWKYFPSFIWKLSWIPYSWL